MSKTIKLTDEQVEEFKEVFNIFDKTNSGAIPTGELSALLAQLGQKTSDYEIKELSGEVDPKGSGKCTFPAFLDAMAKRVSGVICGIGWLCGCDVVVLKHGGESKNERKERRWIFKSNK